MFNKYTIGKNDNLKNMASRFNTTEKVIKDINNMYRDEEYVSGKEIIIPSSKDYFTYYVVEKGDSLYRIAQKYNINPELLAILNGINTTDYIYSNEELLIPKGNYSYYITKDGDTFNEVIRLFGIDNDKFLKDNETIYLMGGQLLVNKKES